MMDKRTVFVLVFLCCSTATFAQTTVGFTFSPLLSTNRVFYDRDSQGRDFTSNDTGLRFSGGPIVDIGLTHNYFVSSGIQFIYKRAGITYRDAQVTIDEVYNLQYVALPATLKLFTNEISLDTKVFFQFGGTLEFLVSDKSKTENNMYITEFGLFDTSLLFGIGVEYKAGFNTSLFGGFSYNRGLLNTVKETVPLENKLVVKNDLLSLNLGIKF